MQKLLLQLFACSVLLLLPGAAGAQPGSVSFKWGEEYELTPHHADLGLWGNPADGYVQMAYRKFGALSMQKFNPDLHFLEEKEIDMSGLPEDCAHEFVLRLAGKDYWFFSTGDRGEDVALYAQEVSFRDMAFVGKPKLLLKVVDHGPNLFKNEYDDQPWYKFAYAQSPDKSKLMIAYRKKPAATSDRQNHDRIGLQLFDNTLTKLGGAEMGMPYTESMMESHQFFVDDKGTVSLTITAFSAEEPRLKMASRDRHPRIEVLRWSPGSTVLAKVSLRMNSYFVSGIRAGQDREGKDILAGFYADNKGSIPAGVFVQRLDGDLKDDESAVKVYKFPADTLSLYRERIRQAGTAVNDDEEVSPAMFKGNTIRKNDNFFEPMTRKVVANDDGSLALYGELEQTRKTVESSGAGHSSFTVTTHLCRDIWAAKIGADGKLAWFTIIPKHQTGATGYDDISYKCLAHNGAACLVYFDGPREKPFMGGNKGTLVASVIDGDGHTSKVTLDDMSEDGMKLDVRNYREVDGSRLILRGRGKHKSDQVSLVTFQ